MKKKRHHYVPRAYLKAFCDKSGKIYVCRKDDPEKELHQSPGNVGFRKHYYSQPTPDGGRDHNGLENHFGKYEATWTGVVERLRAKESDSELLQTILLFVMLQRARVPAMRDANEKMLAESVKAASRMMRIVPETLAGRYDLAIDPQNSIKGMRHIIMAMLKLIKGMEFKVYHNETDIPYLTSDNPVIYYDPETPIDMIQPYIVDRGLIQLLFPVAPNLLLCGNKIVQRPSPRRDRLTHEATDSVYAVEWANTLICRFAYEAVFSNRPEFSNLVKKYADTSPVIRMQVIPFFGGGPLLVHRWTWGKRTQKPKWQPRETE